MSYGALTPTQNNIMRHEFVDADNIFPAVGQGARLRFSMEDKRDSFHELLLKLPVTKISPTTRFPANTTLVDITAGYLSDDLNRLVKALDVGGDERVYFNDRNLPYDGCVRRILNQLDRSDVDASSIGIYTQETFESRYGLTWA